MKIALITDTHWGFKNDSQEILEYFEKFYRDQFWPVIRDRNIKQIIHLGDIVDRRKYINYVTLNAFKTDFISMLFSTGANLLVLVGNHDVPYRNTNSINAMNQLFSNDAMITVISEPTVVEFDFCKIQLMPWINSGNYEKCISILNKSKADILFGHLEIKGFEMHRGMPSQDGFSRNIFDKFDLVCSGHFHRKSTNNNINYLGAPYELTWADYDDARGFHIFDTQTRELEFIRNNVPLFKKIWYDDSDNDRNKVLNIDYSSFKDTYVKVIAQSKTNALWFEHFIDKLSKAKPIDIQIVDDHNNIDQLNDASVIDNAEDTFSIINSCVNTIEGYDNIKDDLNTFMKQLYDDAIRMENIN